jgi:hypothetical protein
MATRVRAHPEDPSSLSVSGSLNSTIRVAGDSGSFRPLLHAEKRAVNALDRGHHVAIRFGMDTTMTVLKTGCHLADTVFAAEQSGTQLSRVRPALASTWAALIGGHPFHPDQGPPLPFRAVPTF